MTKDEKALEKLEKEVTKLRNKISEKKSSKKFLCMCGKMHKVCDCVAFQDWWEHPMEGTMQPGSFYIQCCESTIINKIVLTYPRMYEFKEKNERYFKKWSDREVSVSMKSVLNDYFDKHHGKFGMK